MQAKPRSLRRNIGVVRGEKAKRLNVKIINEKEFLHLIK